MDFSKEEILKVLLQFAGNKRKLSKEEQKIDAQLAKLPEEIVEKIAGALVKESYIKTHMVLPESKDPSVVVFPFASWENEGLTEQGEYYLKNQIDSFNVDKNEKRNQVVCGVSKSVFGWIMGIIAALIVGFLLWKFGWS